MSSVENTSNTIHEAELLYDAALVRLAANRYWRSVVFARYGLVLVAVTLLAGWLLTSGAPSWLKGVIATLLVLAWLLPVYGWFYQHNMAKAKLAAFGFPARAVLRAADDHFSLSSQQGDYSSPWSSIQTIRQYPEHWTWLLRGSGVATIPTAGMGKDMQAFVVDHVLKNGGKLVQYER